MAELKKFLFDNFVVGGCDTKLPEPLPDIVDEMGEDIEDFASFSVSQVIEPEEPMFRQAEVDEKITEASQNGYEKGYKKAQEDIATEANILMSDISQKLTVLLANSAERERVREQETMHVIKQALNVLVPNLLEENAVALVNKFLQDNFNNFKYNEKLSFYINPDIISYIQDSIVKLANSNDFEGKISIHKDSSLERCACRIEWENGGVEYSPGKQLEQISQMLDKQ